MSVLNTLRKISGHHQNKKPIKVNLYTLKNFDQSKIPKEVFDWLKSPFKKALILTGLSGSGKTQLAAALLANDNPLFVSHTERLTSFNKKLHRSIIFDDCSLSHLNREETIALIDSEMSRDLRVLYKIADIPPNIKKIFTSNKEKITPYQDLPEIKRRILISKIDKKMFTINVNITTNITNNTININKDNKNE